MQEIPIPDYPKCFGGHLPQKLIGHHHVHTIDGDICLATFQTRDELWSTNWGLADTRNAMVSLPLKQLLRKLNDKTGRQTNCVVAAHLHAISSWNCGIELIKSMEGSRLHASL